MFKTNKKFNMLKEIFEQPEIVENIIKEHIDDEQGQVRFESFKAILPELTRVKRILLLGCGTSYHAAIYGGYVIEELAVINCEVELADEFKIRNSVIEKDTLIIALSQSGETTDVINSVKIARKKGALIISLTNGIGSTLSKISEATVYNCAGKELALAATKTFSSQLVLLLMIAMYLAQMLKRNFAPVAKLISELKELPEKIAKTLDLEAIIRVQAKQYKNQKNIVILGEKYNYPVALESGLKLKETTYIRAEGFAGGEFRHGPIAIVEKGFPCIFISPHDSTYDFNRRLLAEVKQAGAKTLVLITQTDPTLAGQADEVLLLPEASEILMPVLTVLPIQLLAFYIARAKGVDVDQPRNLNKFVLSTD